MTNAEILLISNKKADWFAFRNNAQKDRIGYTPSNYMIRVAPRNYLNNCAFYNLDYPALAPVHSAQSATGDLRHPLRRNEHMSVHAPCWTCSFRAIALDGPSAGTLIQSFVHKSSDAVRPH